MYLQKIDNDNLVRIYDFFSATIALLYTVASIKFFTQNRCAWQPCGGVGADAGPCDTSRVIASVVQIDRLE